jgi:two-component system, chemotaxis family, chemotaxis protein CheY
MAKIMLVDESNFIRLVIKRMIISEGHEIYEVSSGKESILKYDELKPDIVFMDINLPDILGLEATEKIMKKHPNATIIMCSVIADSSYKMKAKEIGAKDYLVKPFDKEQIVSIINKYTKK